MRIGLAQIACKSGDIGANVAKFGRFAAQAQEGGCDVVIFPEMSDTGYIVSEIPKFAQPWPGRSFDAASKAASQNSINLLCGIAEKVGASIYNSLAFFDRSGELRASYRKAHLFTPAPACEDKCFAAGSELCVTEVEGVKWGLSICYDLRFPELYRSLTLEGAQVLLNCSAWPNLRPTHWDYLTRARAIENQAFFIGLGRVGTDGDLTFNGHSRIVSPMGELVVDGSPTAEELVMGELDLSKVSEFRKMMPVLASRRPDIYGDLKGER